MQKKYSPFRTIAFISMVICMMACVTATTTNTDKQTDTKDLKDFSNINFNISGDLYLTQGGEFSVKIEADPSDLEKIITYVEDKTLIIKSKPGFHNFNKVVVRVTMPEIEGLAVAGSGNINATEAIKSSNIDLSVAGSGNINIDNLTSDDANASIAGSGNITIKGMAGHSFNASIAGSGDINCDGFESKDVTVSIAGSGSARVFASENLSTSIVGSGDVLYNGKPLVNANSTGSGSTRHL